MTPGILLEDHVVLADRLSFFLRSQRSFIDRFGSSPPGLLSSNRRFRSPTLTRGLFAAILDDLLRIRRRRRRSTCWLIRLQPGLIMPVDSSLPRSVLYCDHRLRPTHRHLRLPRTNARPAGPCTTCRSSTTYDPGTTRARSARTERSPGAIRPACASDAPRPTCVTHSARAARSTRGPAGTTRGASAALSGTWSARCAHEAIRTAARVAAAETAGCKAAACGR